MYWPLFQGTRYYICFMASGAEILSCTLQIKGKKKHISHFDSFKRENMVDHPIVKHSFYLKRSSRKVVIPSKDYTATLIDLRHDACQIPKNELHRQASEFLDFDPQTDIIDYIPIRPYTDKAMVFQINKSILDNHVNLFGIHQKKIHSISTIDNGINGFEELFQLTDQPSIIVILGKTLSRLYSHSIDGLFHLRTIATSDNEKDVKAQANSILQIIDGIKQNLISNNCGVGSIFLFSEDADFESKLSHELSSNIEMPITSIRAHEIFQNTKDQLSEQKLFLALNCLADASGKPKKGIEFITEKFSENRAIRITQEITIERLLVLLLFVLVSLGVLAWLQYSNHNELNEAIQHVEKEITTLDNEKRTYVNENNIIATMPESFLARKHPVKYIIQNIIKAFEETNEKAKLIWLTDLDINLDKPSIEISGSALNKKAVNNLLSHLREEHFQLTSDQQNLLKKLEDSTSQKDIDSNDLTSKGVMRFQLSTQGTK